MGVSILIFQKSGTHGIIPCVLSGGYSSATVTLEYGTTYYFSCTAYSNFYANGTHFMCLLGNTLNASCTTGSNRVYLYNNGDQCTALTGGYTTLYGDTAGGSGSSGWSGSPSWTYTPYLGSYIPETSYAMSSSNNVRGTMTTRNKIDITNYTMIYFDMEVSFTSTYQYQEGKNCYFYALLNFNGRTFAGSLGTIWQHYDGNRIRAEYAMLYIGDKTGSCYIGFDTTRDLMAMYLKQVGSRRYYYSIGVDTKIYAIYMI